MTVKTEGILAEGAPYARFSVDDLCWEVSRESGERRVLAIRLDGDEHVGMTEAAAVAYAIPRLPALDIEIPVPYERAVVKAFTSIPDAVMVKLFEGDKFAAFAIHTNASKEEWARMFKKTRQKMTRSIAARKAWKIRKAKP